MSFYLDLLRFGLLGTDPTATLEAFRRKPEHARECVADLVLASIDNDDADEAGSRRRAAIDELLAHVFGAAERDALLAATRVLRIARSQPEYADERVYASAILDALPAYLAVRERYEPSVLLTERYQDWHYELGLVTAEHGDRDLARSFWEPLARTEMRDAIAELGFFECQWGEAERAAGWADELARVAPDDEAIARLRARIAASISGSRSA